MDHLATRFTAPSGRAMRFLSIDGSGEGSALVDGVAAGERITLTSMGKPIALVVPLLPAEDPERLDRLIYSARAQHALAQLRATAEESASLTPDEIDAEIRASRSERRSLRRDSDSVTSEATMEPVIRTLSLDPAAVERGERYVERHGITFSQLISDLLLRLPDDEDELTPTVRRLMGIARPR